MEHCRDLIEQQRSAVGCFLAIRFLKELMLLAQKDVIQAVETVLPALAQLCRFRKDSPDEMRGADMFQASTKEARQQAASCLQLALESLKSWAEWLPEQNGGPSKFE